MKERIEKVFKDWPKLKKVIGVILIVYGFIALLTPFTPGSWLAFVGLELLGFDLIFWSKIKVWLKNSDIFKSIFNIMGNKKSVPKNEEEWKKKLTAEQYTVLRGKGTEAPFSGKLLHEKRDGAYNCVACGQPLFSSDGKFDSGTGWPSFDEALPKAIRQIEDGNRTEIVCVRCDSHLGHVFNDGSTKTGKRYCLNSVCLELKDKK